MSICFQWWSVLSVLFLNVEAVMLRETDYEIDIVFYLLNLLKSIYLDVTHIQKLSNKTQSSLKMEMIGVLLESNFKCRPIVAKSINPPLI